MGCMFRFTLCCIANCGNELGNYYIDRTFRSFRMADNGNKKTLSPLQIRQKASHQPQQRHKGTYIINSLYTIFISHASQYSRSNTGNSKSETKEQPGNQGSNSWAYSNMAGKAEESIRPTQKLSTTVHASPT